MLRDLHRGELECQPASAEAGARVSVRFVDDVRVDAERIGDVHGRKYRCQLRKTRVICCQKDLAALRGGEFSWSMSGKTRRFREATPSSRCEAKRLCRAS